MKKLLTLISALGMTTTGIIGAADVVSCSKKDKTDNKADDKVNDNKMNEGDKLLVTIKGGSVANFDSADKSKDKDGNTDIVVAEIETYIAPTTLQDDASTTKTKLSEILSKNEAKNAVALGADIETAKTAIISLITTNVTGVIENDITVEKEKTIDSVLKVKDLGDIVVPDEIYGLEKVDFSNPGDRTSDIDKINEVIFDSINDKNKDSSIKLSADNAEVVYAKKPDDKYVPPKATIKMKTNSGSKVLGLAGKAEVEFELQQNIDPFGFIFVTSENNGTENTEIKDKSAKFSTKDLNSKNEVNLFIKKGTAAIYLGDTNIKDFESWEYGDKKDYWDDFVGIENTSNILVNPDQDQSKYKYITIVPATAKPDASKAQNHIHFNVHGFKTFTINIWVVESL